MIYNPKHTHFLFGLKSQMKQTKVNHANNKQLTFCLTNSGIALAEELTAPSNILLMELRCLREGLKTLPTDLSIT